MENTNDVLTVPWEKLRDARNEMRSVYDTFTACPTEGNQAFLTLACVNLRNAQLAWDDACRSELARKVSR